MNTFQTICGAIKRTLGQKTRQVILYSYGCSKFQLSRLKKDASRIQQVAEMTFSRYVQGCVKRDRIRSDMITSELDLFCVNAELRKNEDSRGLTKYNTTDRQTAQEEKKDVGRPYTRRLDFTNRHHLILQLRTITTTVYMDNTF